MPNNINSVSPDLRDFLLNRNIISDTVKDNGLESLLHGIGLPSTISNYNGNVQPGIDILVDGEHYKDLNIINNKFQVSDEEYRLSQVENIPGSRTPFSVRTNSDEYLNNNLRRNVFRADDFLYSDASIILNSSYQPSTQQDSYLDEYGNLNVGGPSTEALDIIGSVLNGGGIGFDPNGGGVVPNFDVRSSLAGRVLVGTGVINDTKMGQLSVGYLASALGNNALFGVQEEILGNINLNPLSLIMGNDIIRANYTITVAKSTLGKAVDLLERILGFERPVSIIDNGASIFGSENGWVSSLTSSQSLIGNTGKGQVLRLFYNLNANSDVNLIGKRFGYAPAYSDDRTERGANQGVYSADVYPFVNSTSDKDNAESFNKDFDENLYLYDAIGDGYDEFIWTDSKFNNPASTIVPGTEQGLDPQTFRDSQTFVQPKGLLYKTKELFNSNKMRTLTSGHFLKPDDSEVLISKGSGVRNPDGPDASGNPFCRTWTPYDRYNKVEDLQKHSGLDTTGRAKSGNYAGFSVLDDNGFVKIGPQEDDTKRYMFSIENLAWVGETNKLLPSEIGNGDLVTGKKGRIMWFPPYDMTFNETTSVSWDKNVFIGRGEPVYTYNNTERTGNLSWKIVIDHPNYLNYMKDKSDEEIASFFAGCMDIEDIANKVSTQEERDAIEIINHTETRESVDDEKINPTEFKIYFANDNSTVDSQYENGKLKDSPLDDIDYLTNPNGAEEGLGTTTTDNGGTDVDNTDYGLNGQSQRIEFGDITSYGISDPDFISELKLYFNEKCKYCKITITGYASKHGTTDANLVLSEKRGNSIKSWFEANIIDSDNDRISIKTNGEGETGSGCSGDDQKDKKQCKEARYALINIEYSPELKKKDDPILPKVSTNGDDVVNTDTFNYGRFYTEEHYFKKMEQTDPTVYSSLKQKIAFFQPAFHGITPEGFNSRLTFLQQCTRQGPTVNDNVKNPNNLVFGRPPVCILRIGDFYNTKIIIDNMALDYEPLVWDLNPEGVGVQPMIVTVNMSFAFIGGSSLTSPINKLQNAVSYNYFANTEVYDARADRVSFKTTKDRGNNNVLGDGELIPGVFPGVGERFPSKSVNTLEPRGITNNGLDGLVVDQEGIAAIENNKQEI